MLQNDAKHHKRLTHLYIQSHLKSYTSLCEKQNCVYTVTEVFYTSNIALQSSGHQPF